MELLNSTEVVSGTAELNEATASGDIVVQAQKSLDARINGSGDIKYVGEPAHLITAVHGSGSIGRD